MKDIFEQMVLEFDASSDVRRNEEDELIDSQSLCSSGNLQDSLEASSLEWTDEEVCSPYGCKPSSPPAVSCSPLYELSALMENLPIKRSLSRHYQGKSQSFSSLTNVKSIEDLVKIDKKPYKKKKSKLRIHNEASSDVPSLHVVRTSQQIGKRNPSGSSCSSLFSRNSSFINRRPPLQRNIL